jgi:predicted phage terminase large subunit-like protein
MSKYNSAVLAALPLAAAEWEVQQRTIRQLMETSAVEPWSPMRHQIAPDGDWRVWLLEGGRGSGKTDGAAAYLDAHCNGPACIPRIPGGHRPAIIAPTLGDALEACVNGPSGLKAHNPAVVSVQTAGGTFVRWPNGVEGKVFGAFTPEDVERLRAGGNRCVVWAEELAAWARLDQAWDQMRFGLRLGPRPHVVASSTPKPRKKYLAIRSDEGTVRTGASTADNPHLTETVRAEYFKTYGGTRLGRQELNAEILLDVPGALWTWAMLSNRAKAPDLTRVVVAIDPSVTSGEDADETGIVVAGLGVDGRGYVLADRSCRLSPDGWARRAVAAFDDHRADLIVAEVNNGGDLVEQTIRTVRRSISYRKVHASRGKQIRAQPVAALYEQGKVSHVESFPELEEQLTSWTPESGTSPDRLDALVWALTELMVKGGREAWAV